MTETDQINNNDTLRNSVVITNTMYARDKGDFVGSQGIGAGDGYIGQAFRLTNQADVGSVIVGYKRGYKGRRYAAAIWNTVNNKPNAIVATTDTLLYPDDEPLIDTLPVHGVKVTLDSGTYVVTAIEFDSTLAIIQTKDIFTAGAIWVSWSIMPWRNLETFGTIYERPFYIRLNNVTKPCNNYVWVGTLNDQWDIGENWSCGTVPPPGSDVLIPSGLVRLNVDATVGSLKLNAAATLDVLPGKKLTVTH
jgi:hypothetical protein